MADGTAGAEPTAGPQDRSCSTKESIGPALGNSGEVANDGQLSRRESPRNAGPPTRTGVAVPKDEGPTRAALAGTPWTDKESLGVGGGGMGDEFVAGRSAAFPTATPTREGLGVGVEGAVFDPVVV